MAKQEHPDPLPVEQLEPDEQQIVLHALHDYNMALADRGNAEDKRDAAIGRLERLFIDLPGLQDVGVVVGKQVLRWRVSGKRNPTVDVELLIRELLERGVQAALIQQAREAATKPGREGAYGVGVYQWEPE